MADLDVQPKKSSPWWLWLLLAIIAIALIIFLLNRNDNDIEHREEDYNPETGSVETPSSTLYALRATTVEAYPLPAA